MKHHLRLALLGLAATASFSAAACPGGQAAAPAADQQAASREQSGPAGVSQKEQLAAYTSRWSDVRLKSGIVPVGTGPLGIGVYEYEIFGRRELGVLAQELEKVLPQAVITTESGYKMVRYDLIPGWDKFIADRQASAEPRLHQAAYMRWSDQRLKSRIVRVGEL